MPPAVLDVPALRQEIVKVMRAVKYKAPSSPKSGKHHVRANKSSATKMVSNIVQNEMLLHALRATSLPGVIDKCGRKVDFKKLAGCKVVGQGAFGIVLDTGNGRCVKVERDIEPDTVRTGMRAAIKMGAEGIGPTVHSWTLCECAAVPILFVEMDLIHGMDLHTWLHSTRPRRADVAAVRSKLRAKVSRMRDEFGIRHNDLHMGNVRLDDSLEPWILDYSFASEVDNVSRWFDAVEGVGGHHGMFRYVWSKLLDRKLVVQEECAPGAGPRLAALLSGTDIF